MKDVRSRNSIKAMNDDGDVLIRTKCNEFLDSVFADCEADAKRFGILGRPPVTLFKPIACR